MSIDEAVSRLRVAEHSWHTALKQHRLAPPDAGYPHRLADLADACAQQQSAYEYAHANGLTWDPNRFTDTIELPHELQPTSGRYGNPKLWEQLDSASAQLAQALQGTSLDAIAHAFGEISLSARALSRDIAQIVAASDRQHG